MNCLKRCCLLALLLASGKNVFSAPSVITDGRAICAYGTNGAYLVTYPDGVYGDLYRWNSVTEQWVQITNLGPRIRQMDCLNSGEKLIGTDVDKHAKAWSHILGYASPWSDPRGTKVYDWVLHDSVGEEARGMIAGLEGAWESWDKPVLQPTDPWNKYTNAEPASNDRMRNTWLVDRNLAETRYKRWERDDIDYFVTLNMGGTDYSKPFFIYAYSDNENLLLERITNPPLLTHNIDDVVVRQISYDEDNHNLWCVDVDGVPWQWDNADQQWIKRDVRSEETFIQEPEEEGVPQWLREECDYYVRTVYIEGDYRPMLLVFRETHEMLLFLGELSRSIMDSIDIIVCDPPKRDHKFHTILLQPKETPQKIVRIDGGKRIQENHHLERLLINNHIIPDEFAIGVYPVSQWIVRR